MMLILYADELYDNRMNNLRINVNKNENKKKCRKTYYARWGREKKRQDFLADLIESRGERKKTTNTELNKYFDKLLQRGQ